MFRAVMRTLLFDRTLSQLPEYGVSIRAAAMRGAAFPQRAARRVGPTPPWHESWREAPKVRILRCMSPTPDISATAQRETALYAAVKNFLEALGFDAKGEICGCDIVAIRTPAQPILVIVEMKLSFTLELVLQAVDRLPIADEVWLAVRASTRGRDRDGRVRKLCRLLGFGLLRVAPASGQVEVLAEPAPYRPRLNEKRRSRLLEEHQRRLGDPACGGSTRQPIMTAYRQRALACATALQSGPRPVRALRAVADDASAIVQRNVYGWFERERRGIYRLSPTGHAATARWNS